MGILNWNEQVEGDIDERQSTARNVEGIILFIEIKLENCLLEELIYNFVCHCFVSLIKYVNNTV